MDTIGIVVEFTLLKENFDELDGLLRDHAKKTRKLEPGCLRFEVVHVFDGDGRVDRSRIALFEVYSDADNYALHTNDPRMTSFREIVARLTSSRRILKGRIVA